MQCVRPSPRPLPDRNLASRRAPGGHIDKGSSGNKRAIWGIVIRGDGVVPLTVELGTFDVDGSHFGVGDNDAAGALASVKFAAHGEAGFGGRGRDQLANHAIAQAGVGTPILADEGEEAVLDFVPLAGARRQVADHDVEAETTHSRSATAAWDPFWVTQLRIRNGSSCLFADLR